MTAEDYIRALGMEPLADEGGWFAPVWRSADDKTQSVIYYLLKKGEVSRWHQLKSNEVWTWHAGGTLEMTLGGTGDWPHAEKTQTVGPGSFVGAVPAETWQTTRVAQGDFALVSCVVAPAFQDADCYLPHPSVEEVEQHGRL